MINVDKIFIIHYKKLTDRRKFMEEQLRNSGLENNVEWLTNFDKDEWDLDNIKKTYPHMFDGSGIHCKLLETKLHISDVSLSLKHAYILNKIVEENLSSALIFEDDVWINSDFVEKFNLYKTQLPENWHIFFPGTDFQVSENIIPNKHIYEKKGFHSTRGTFCFAVNNVGAKLMNPLFKTIDDPSDWYYNYVIEKLNINNFWAEPPIAKHNGSLGTTRYYDYTKYNEKQKSLI